MFIGHKLGNLQNTTIIHLVFIWIRSGLIIHITNTCICFMVISIYRYILYEPHRWCNGSKMKRQNKQLARVLEIACLSPDRVKDYKIMLLHVALRSKNKDWLARNRDTIP